jgi:hypothetical protein
MWIPTILAKVENESIVKYKISKRKKEKIYLYKDGCLMLLQMVDDGATSENVYKIDKDLYQPENKQIVIAGSVPHPSKVLMGRGTDPKVLCDYFFIKLM